MGCAKLLLVATLFLTALAYGLIAARAWVDFECEDGRARRGLSDAYECASDYRKKTGGWPKDLRDANMDGKSVRCASDATLRPVDHVSGRPLLYYPSARPGTGDILLAQPDAFKMRFWPSFAEHRWGIRADGKFVRLQPGEIGSRGSQEMGMKKAPP